MRLPTRTLNAINDSNGGTIRKGSVGFITVFFMLYVYVSSGAYGLEDVVSQSGPGTTVIVLILLAIFWGTPYGLISSELSAEYPMEGGIYAFVRESFGEFWGYIAGWCFTLMCQVDTAVYLVLVVGHIEIFLDLDPIARIALIIGMALIVAYINLKGIEVVGVINVIFCIASMTPFIILIVLGFAEWNYNPLMPFYNDETGLVRGIGLALIVGIWQFSGYECLSSMGEEIEDSKKLIPKAMVFMMPMVALMYILPTVAGLAAVGNWENWAADSGEGLLTFIDIGGIVGGKPLMIIFVIGAFISLTLTYIDYIASGSRVPYVMSEDKLFPKSFVKLHKKLKTPYISIIIMSVICILLAVSGTFSTLIVLDVSLYMIALILMFMAAIKTRKGKPRKHGTYRLPISDNAYVLMASLVIGICIITLFTNGIGGLIGGMIGVLSGPVTFILFREMYGGFENPGIYLNKVSSKTKLLAFLLPVMGIKHYKYYANNKHESEASSIRRMSTTGSLTWIVLIALAIWAIKGNLLELLAS